MRNIRGSKGIAERVIGDVENKDAGGEENEEASKF